VGTMLIGANDNLVHIGILSLAGSPLTKSSVPGPAPQTPRSSLSLERLRMTPCLSLHSLSKDDDHNIPSSS
jgi:hypothetical protein